MQSDKPDFSKEKQEILDSLAKYHKRWNQSIVATAFDFAVESHDNQWRQSGLPYVTHPIAVAKILIELKTDHIAVAAALLHDVIEDADVTYDEIKEKFGQDIALLVNGVTKISGVSFQTSQERQAETLRKMLLSMMKDLRVILIKFADRLHNMRTISAMPEKSQRRIAQETRDVYAPMAHRLGIAKIAREMDELALKVLDIDAYKHIESRVENTSGKREEILGEIITPIIEELARIEIPNDIQGRVKSISSIYNKIHKQGKTFDEIYDLLAIRIIVKNKSECYRVLGVVHDLYTPVSDHFFDYIALPKSNLYQSLHTKVRDKQNRIVEVQIRTHEMHSLAEIGIAAHWRYKEGALQPDNLDDHFTWIRSLMEAHKEGAESGEFLESLKIDLFQDEIYVFTPQGKLIQLPVGATPVDFAYAIHSEIGNHALGAKVKGRVVAMNHSLESGDIVEILTSDNQAPNIEWLKFVRTSRARNRIKRWFRERRFEQSKTLGEELVAQELNRLKLPKNPKELVDVAISFGYVEMPEFFASLGAGQISLAQIMRKLVPMVAPRKDALISRIIQKIDKRNDKIRVGGLDNLVVSIADCCNPLPGDPIIGFQENGRGLFVHRTDCFKVADLLEKDRKIISVAWDVEREDRFKVNINLVADDRANLLRDVTQVISSVQVNLHKIDMHIEDKLVIGHLVAEVRNLPHLTRLLGRINQIKGILRAERIDMVQEESKAAS